MTLSHYLPPVFTRNPIVQAELAYQSRPTGRQRWWSRWLTRVVVVCAVMLALILYGGELLGAVLRRDPTPIGERLSVGVALLLIFTLALHFVLVFRALALGANSIAREKQNNTWDMLVLTGIDARQIVLGKWWATVQRLWRWYTLLGVLRAAALVWMSGSSSRGINSLYASYSGSYYFSWYGMSAPPPAHILLAGVIVIALTLANLAFTAACGVMSSGDARSSVMALVRAIMSRMAALVVAALLLTWLAVLLSPLVSGLGGITSQGGILLLDNGASLSSYLAVYRSEYYGALSVDFVLPAACLGLGAYLLITWAMLQTAQQRAVRHRALMPARAK